MLKTKHTRIGMIVKVIIVLNNNKKKKTEYKPQCDFYEIKTSFIF